MKIKGLIFDFDGTLATPSTLDFTELNQTLAAKAAGLGYLWPSQGYVLERLQGLLAWAERELGSTQAQALALDFREYIKSREVAAARQSRLFGFSLGVLGQAVRQNLRIAIASRNCAEAILAVYPEAAGHVFLPRGACPWVKPDPRHFIQAAKLMGVEIAACAALGDHPMDMQAATAAGCLGIGVLSGLKQAPELLASGAQTVLNDISQLMAWLKSQALL